MSARKDERKPTILGVEHSGSLGGSERIALLALEQLRGRGFRVLLACPPATPLARTAAERGIGVRTFAFRAIRRTYKPTTVAAYARSILVVSRALARVCRDERVAVIHAFSLVSALYALVVARLTRVPLLVHIQDAQPPRRMRRAALKAVARRATLFICVSRAVWQMLRDLGIPAEKLVLLYNAVDLRFLGFPPEPTDQVSGAGPHIGLFAHIIPWKGHHVFLEAAALIASRFPSARFYVVGSRMDGVPQAYIDALRARAESPPLAGRVELVGAQSDVPRWMAAMDVVVHSSVAPEAFGLVIAEAMALGKPVIATDMGAPREFVSHGETGYLARAGDARALANALEHVLEHPDPDLGRRAAAAVRDRFSPESFGAALQRVYVDVLSSAETQARDR